MGENRPLSLKRASSLPSLDLNYDQIIPEGVVFTLTMQTQVTGPEKQFKSSSPAFVLIQICAQYFVLHTTYHTQMRSELFKKENQISCLFFT